MALGKIDHIDLSTGNLEKAEKFLIKLGFKPLRRIEHEDKSFSSELTSPAGDVVFQLRGADEKKLNEKRKQAQGESLFFNHIAFQADDITKEFNEIKSKGVPFKDPAPKYNAESGRKLASAGDEDGRYWIQLSDSD